MALVPQQKENPDMLLNLASVMVASGEREEALKYARSTLAIDPTNIKAYRIIARVYLNQRRYAGVLLVHEMATERTKKQDATLENIRGLAYLGQKEYPLALFAFEQAVKLDPSLFAAQMNLGILAMRYHDNNRSLNALQAASRLRPRNRDALMAYAVALRANKRFADAENVYLKQLLAVNPRDTDSMFNVGLLYVKFMNRPKDGSTYLRRFIGERNEQVPNNHIAYQLLQQAQQAIKMEEQMKQQQKQEQQKPKEQKPKEQKPKEQKPKEQKPKV
jgi:tetratricopeptide (TPR) repeat protein